MSGSDYYSQGSRPIGSLNNAYQLPPSISSPSRPPTLSHHARSDPTGESYFLDNQGDQQQQPTYQRSQSMTRGAYGGSAGNTRWPARPPPSWQTQYGPPSLSPPLAQPSWAPPGPFGMSSAPMVPYAGQHSTMSRSTPFPIPQPYRPAIPPKVPSIHRHSIPSSSDSHHSRHTLIPEEEGFPQEKPRSPGTVFVKPTISVVSATGEQVELDEDQALALAIERSLSSKFSDRPAEVLFEEGDWVPQMSRRPSRPHRDSSSGGGSQTSPRSPHRPDLYVSIPSSTATSSRSSIHRQSAASAVSEQGHDDFSINTATSVRRRDSQQNPVISFESDESTSLPSTMHIPASPLAFQISGPSFNHLLKDLIAQANVRLEPCPTAFESSKEEEPTFTLVCKVQAYYAGPPPSSEPSELKQDGTGRDGLHKTMLYLQAEEKMSTKLPPKSSASGIVTPSNRTTVGLGMKVSTPIVASKTDSNSVRIDFDNSLVLPLTMDTVVERLYTMLKLGQAEAKRASSQLTTSEEICALALCKFVSLHPGPHVEELPAKFRKQQKVSPPSPPPKDTDTEDEMTELTGREKKMGKRFKVRNLTSKVVGAIQGHRHDVPDEQREDWITPFRTDDLA